MILWCEIGAAAAVAAAAVAVIKQNTHIAFQLLFWLCPMLICFPFVFPLKCDTIPVLWRMYARARAYFSVIYLRCMQHSTHDSHWWYWWYNGTMLFSFHLLYTLHRSLSFRFNIYFCSLSSAIVDDVVHHCYYYYFCHSFTKFRRYLYFNVVNYDISMHISSFVWVCMCSTFVAYIFRFSQSTRTSNEFRGGKN